MNVYKVVSITGTSHVVAKDYNEADELFSKTYKYAEIQRIELIDTAIIMKGKE